MGRSIAGIRGIPIVVLETALVSSGSSDSFKTSAIVGERDAVCSEFRVIGEMALSLKD